MERDFPHIVEMAVPPNGFGKRLDAMYDWHRAHGIEARRGNGRREEDRDIVRWCFADQKMANEFVTVFGASTVYGPRRSWPAQLRLVIIAIFWYGADCVALLVCFTQCLVDCGVTKFFPPLSDVFIEAFIEHGAT